MLIHVKNGFPYPCCDPSPFPTYCSQERPRREIRGGGFSDGGGGGLGLLAAQTSGVKKDPFAAAPACSRQERILKGSMKNSEPLYLQDIPSDGQTAEFGGEQQYLCQTGFILPFKCV